MRLGTDDQEDEQPTPGEAGALGLDDDDLGLDDGVEGDDLPRISPRPPTLFMFHPESWFVMEGEVIPLFGALVLRRGVSNVKKGKKKGSVSISQALEFRRKRGWKPVPHKVDGRSYLQRVPTADGRVAYLTRWETAHAGSSVITSDGPGYVAWCRKLLAAGLIERPKPYVLERMLARVATEILQAQDRVRTVPSAQVELDKLLVKQGAIKRELATVTSRPVVGPQADVDDLLDDDDDDDHNSEE